MDKPTKLIRMTLTTKPKPKNDPNFPLSVPTALMDRDVNPPDISKSSSSQCQIGNTEPLLLHRGTGTSSTTHKKNRTQWKHRRSRSTSSLVITCDKSDEDSDDTGSNSKERNDSDDAQRSLARLTITHTQSVGLADVGGTSHGATGGTQRLTKSKGSSGAKHIPESDSFNEVFGSTSNGGTGIPPYLKGAQQSGRRRRRHKRMAVEACAVSGADGIIFKEPLQVSGCSSAPSSGFALLDTGIGDFSSVPAGATALSPQPGPSKPRKKTPSSTGAPISVSYNNNNNNEVSSKGYPLLEFLDIGKRKRANTREKILGGLDSSGTNSSSSNCGAPGASATPGPMEFSSMIGMGLKVMEMDDSRSPEPGIELGSIDPIDQEMMDAGAAAVPDDAVSNISSSDESALPSCDDGQEGDDEQSDWVGDEWMDASEVLGDSEKRRDLIIRRLRDLGPSREIRAGRRRIHPNKPVFSIRTSANEQVSKFLQDPEQSQIKLHPMRKDERLQLSQIASLYSLRMHNADLGSGAGGLYTCPILTKTRNTTQVLNITDRLIGSGPEGNNACSGLGPTNNTTGGGSQGTKQHTESETEVVKRIRM